MDRRVHPSIPERRLYSVRGLGIGRPGVPRICASEVPLSVVAERPAILGVIFRVFVRNLQEHVGIEPRRKKKDRVLPNSSRSLELKNVGKENERKRVWIVIYHTLVGYEHFGGS